MTELKPAARKAGGRAPAAAFPETFGLSSPRGQSRAPGWGGDGGEGGRSGRGGGGGGGRGGGRGGGGRAGRSGRGARGASSSGRVRVR